MGVKNEKHQTSNQTSNFVHEFDLSQFPLDARVFLLFARKSMVFGSEEISEG